ncbi:MAG TPA: hypothetical protein VHI52_15195, partial [Verrucomicrobiae bacterium]|nr:hypothetical protein [Verrucomicrobiae bacterium]
MTKRAVHKPAGLSAVAREISRQTNTREFQDYLRRLLLDLCRVNTTPKSDPALMREAEDCCFKILERELELMQFPGARLERRPIDPRIKNHPHFSLLHFTKTPDHPEGLSAEETYHGRGN